MGAQFIKTPSGDEMVVLPRAEYETLLRAAEEAEEDAADTAAYDAAKADIAGSERLPFEVSQAVLKGAGLLKALRLWRNKGQVELAQHIGTSQGFLSDLENGRRKLTRDVARKLAAALDVPENWLLD
ncbi:MAG: helix-turn-helix domain-containing protein [Devosia sp.]